MSQSGWSYFKSVDFRFCMAVVEGKPLKKGRKGAAIREYVKYPSGFRGLQSIVNINYEWLVKKKSDIAFSKGADSPCVKYALKAHLINTSTTLAENDRLSVMKELLGNQRAGRFTRDTLSVLIGQDVNMPPRVGLRDMRKLERRLECPVVLYALHNVSDDVTWASRAKEREDDRDDDDDDDDDDRDDHYVPCLLRSSLTLLLGDLLALLSLHLLALILLVRHLQHEET